jgi:hypothetical protein
MITIKIACEIKENRQIMTGIKKEDNRNYLLFNQCFKRKRASLLIFVGNSQLFPSGGSPVG